MNEITNLMDDFLASIVLKTFLGVLKSADSLEEKETVKEDQPKLKVGSFCKIIRDKKKDNAIHNFKIGDEVVIISDNNGYFDCYRPNATEIYKRQLVKRDDLEEIKFGN